MSDELREQAAWRKGKTPIVRKYQEEHEKIISTIAGRGFQILPGHAYDSEMKLETTTKFLLSELNYKILSDTIDRELKQAGIDDDIEYKTKVMAWEAEKFDLLADWSSELAGIKQQEAQEEENLARLAIAVTRRGITLLEAKTALEIRKEAYLLELAGLDADIYPLEVQLANKKLLTAQTKLNIIPILEEIVAKELDLLAIEQQKAGVYTALMAEEQEIATKTVQLLPYLQELTNITAEYALKIQEEQVIDGQIANEKLLQAQSFARRAQSRQSELEFEIENTYLAIALSAEKRNLAALKVNNANALDNYEMGLETTYQNTLLSVSNDMMEDDRATQTKLLANKKIVHDNGDNAIRVEHARTISGSRDYISTLISNLEISKIQQMTNLEKNMRLQSALVHLIG